MADPRRVAHRILCRVECGVHADREARAALRRLSPRDRRLALQLAFGCLRLRGRLDAELGVLVDGSLGRLDPPLLNWLRLGLYQLRELRVPDHAAVHQSVEGARRTAGPRAAGLVNAVLRRAARGRADDVYPPPETDLVGYLTTWGSHPEWLVRRWLARWPVNEVRGLVEIDNAPPRVTARLLCGNRAAALVALEARGLRVRPLAEWPRCIELERGDPTDLLALLPVVIQDAAASAVVDYAGPAIEGPVVDLCAAPGGKAIALAAAATAARPFVAADVSGERLRRLLDAPAARHGDLLAVVMDGRVPALAAARTVLVDAPCTGTGTLRRRPDARWRVTRRRLASLVSLQQALLDAAAKLLAPGGLLVYSTCSLEPEENENQVADFLHRHPGFERETRFPGGPLPAGAVDAEGDLVIRPWQWGTDGAYAARLRRRDA